MATSGRAGKIRRDFDDDSQVIIVPSNDKPMVAIGPERVRRLRKHLVGILRDLRTAKHLECLAVSTRPESTGFPARVARTACSLCKGWCCRNGENDGFLDDATLARVRLANPNMTERAMLSLYLKRVPPIAYRDSCIFHGKNGCTLDRSQRADVCNIYYCGDLGAYMKTGAASPTRVIAGEGENMRTSPVLIP